MEIISISDDSGSAHHVYLPLARESFVCKFCRRPVDTKNAYVAYIPAKDKKVVDGSISCPACKETMLAPCSLKEFYELPKAIQELRELSRFSLLGTVPLLSLTYFDTGTTVRVQVGAEKDVLLDALPNRNGRLTESEESGDSKGARAKPKKKVMRKTPTSRKATVAKKRQPKVSLKKK